MVEAGAVKILIEIAIARFVDVEDVALRALSTVANLAFNSEANIVALMEGGAVKGVESALQKWPKHARILENAMCALSNLMFGSDENKLVIGQTCGDEVSNIIRDHPSDGNLFKMALRALGNLSFCDENIRFIVEQHHATKAIVAGMRANPKDEEAQQLAMEVIGNFASLGEAPPELDAEGNIVNPKDSIAMIILREAGCAAIITALKTYAHNPAIVRAGLDALCNLANDVEVTEIMARKQGLLSATIEVLRTNDWDLELIARAVTLLGVISYARDVLPLLVGVDGIQALLTTMEAHPGVHDILAPAQLALTNLAAAEEARTAIRNMEGVASLLALLEMNMAMKD
jgi:hypothetical protein